MVEPHEAPHEHSLGQLLGHVCRLVGHRRRMKMEGIGLHYAQGMILFRLWREDGTSQRALAQALHITPPTATNTLKRMERDGWITRRRDESDQRIVRVYLTEKSRTLQKEARASFLAMDQEMTSMLTAPEIETLRQSLLKVHRYLASEAPGDGDAPCAAGQVVRPDGQEKTR